jgi:hypothetical protein
LEDIRTFEVRSARARGARWEDCWLNSGGFIPARCTIGWWSFRRFRLYFCSPAQTVVSATSESRPRAVEVRRATPAPVLVARAALSPDPEPKKLRWAPRRQIEVPFSTTSAVFQAFRPVHQATCDCENTGSVGGASSGLGHETSLQHLFFNSGAGHRSSAGRWRLLSGNCNLVVGTVFRCARVPSCGRARF